MGRTVVDLRLVTMERASVCLLGSEAALVKVAKAMRPVAMVANKGMIILKVGGVL